MLFKNNKIIDSLVSSIKNEMPTLDQACIDDQLCYKYIHNIPLIYMRLLGLIHFKTDHFGFKCYRIFFIICCWTTVIKFLSAFEVFYGVSEPFNKNLIIKICMLIWFSVQAIHTTANFIIMEKDSYKNEFIKKLNYFLKKDENMKKDLNSLRKKFFIMFFVLFIFLIINTISVFLSFFGPKQFEPLFLVSLAPFHNPNDPIGTNTYYRLFQTYLIFCSSSVWTTLIIHFSTDCLTIQKLLENFYEKFNKYVAKIQELSMNNINESDKIKLEEEFESFRIEHLKFSDLVLSLNKCNMIIVSTSLLFYQASNLLILYIMSNWTNNCINGILAFIYPFWLFTNILIIALCIYRSSQIFVWLHKPLKSVFNLTMKQFSVSFGFKIDLFINKLVNDRTGLSVLNTIVIDKGFIISVITSTLAYFFVLIKFKDSGSVSC